jgi:hypothetical protein
MGRDAPFVLGRNLLTILKARLGKGQSDNSEIESGVAPRLWEIPLPPFAKGSWGELAI